MTTLSKDEHIATANELVRRYQQENEPGGNSMVAAEMLWGAFAHALIAVANEKGWHYDSHGALKRASLRLAQEQNRSMWANDFASAERLHSHFYHGNLSPRFLNNYANDAVRGIRSLMQLLDTA